MQSGWRPNIQWNYRYIAELGHGFETNHAYIGTGLEADVTVVLSYGGETLWIQVNAFLIFLLALTSGDQKECNRSFSLFADQKCNRYRSQEG